MVWKEHYYQTDLIFADQPNILPLLLGDGGDVQEDTYMTVHKYNTLHLNDLFKK